jgi:Spy/CpxP family protein refolding chaperone
MEHAARTRLTTALVLAVVFGAGVLLGVAADSQLGAEPGATAAEEIQAPERVDRPGTPLSRQVDPTPEQLALIDSIVLEHRARTNALDKETRRAYRRGFRDILLQTRESIKGVLTPEQAAEYQRLVEELDARQEAERQSRDRK